MLRNKCTCIDVIQFYKSGYYPGRIAKSSSAGISYELLLARKTLFLHELRYFIPFQKDLCKNGKTT